MLLFGGHVWRGYSRKRYRFKIALTKNGLPKDGEGGVYVFVRRRFVFFLEPLYVGKATDLRSRLLGHEKWARAYWWYGATERHVIKIKEPHERNVAEEDLIIALRPPMNDMMIPRSANDRPIHKELLPAWRMEQWWKGLWAPRGRGAVAR
jgi:hypothetical protein